ncbi:MAG: class I SAM-dependent methyltransferase [Alphaproteobacteria bacterium]
MNSIEAAVARHYGDAGLLARILAGLEASGLELDSLRPDDLAPVDEFHIGGREATAHAVAKLDLDAGAQVLDVAKLDLDAGAQVLDVGCGIGGAARYLATQVGCRVTGVDLTPEFIATARRLTELTGLDGKISFKCASALDMPFEDGTFDAAITLHVAMNIPERAALYCEIARVMKPGAAFCIYDVMKAGAGELAYPVPWAETPATSHLTSAEEMRGLLDTAGFDVSEVEDRSDFARTFFQGVLAAVAASEGGPPPLGIHLILGASAPEKFRNMLNNIEAGHIAPVQMIATRRPA